MVRERNPSTLKEHSSTPTKAQTQSPNQPSFQRTPLANISAKMQSSQSKQASNANKPSSQDAPAFGEASPLRNPLASRPKPSVFVPKPRTFQHPSVTNGASQAPRSTSGFRLPGQGPPSDPSASLHMMQEYMDNGARLGWLLDPQSQQVEIYRQGQDKEILVSPSSLSGEEVLPGFVLDLRGIL